MSPHSDQSSPASRSAMSSNSAQPGASNTHPLDLHPIATSGASIAPAQTQAVEAIVMKAKQLLEQPGANPYDQSRALQVLKAQYVYARYTINLKITQD